MSNENINNDDEESIAKVSIYLKDQDTNKNNNIISSPEKKPKKVRQRRFSNLDNLRPSISIEDKNDPNNIEKIKKNLKRGLTKRVPNLKKKER